MKYIYIRVYSLKRFESLLMVASRALVNPDRREESSKL